ncbi:hypothetical protein [Lapillicoccus sp.]|nr:hypothetical protein [Lapillicoccus sp.]
MLDHAYPVSNDVDDPALQRLTLDPHDSRPLHHHPDDKSGHCCPSLG